MDEISNTLNYEKSQSERRQDVKDCIDDLNEIELLKLERLLNTFRTVVMTVSDCAITLGVHVHTIRRAINTGKLRAFQQVKEGHWLIRTRDFLKYADTRKAKKKYIKGKK